MEQNICPKCQTDRYIDDMVRYLICDNCNAVRCPGCLEWINGGEDGLINHYYLKGCRLIE